jgi:hypothetical protein
MAGLTVSFEAILATWTIQIQDSMYCSKWCYLTAPSYSRKTIQFHMVQETTAHTDKYGCTHKRAQPVATYNHVLHPTYSTPMYTPYIQANTIRQTQRQWTRTMQVKLGKYKF